VRLPIEPPNSGDLPEIAAVLGDPAASSWLKACLWSALSRDPVDAANDAEILAQMLARWCRDILSPDLVVAADTVVLTHAPPTLSSTPYSELPGFRPELLEKPTSRDDNLRMLLDLNGGRCEVITGVSIVFPVLEAPGYKIHSMDDRTLVTFSDNPASLLGAYADSGEGIDRAGGFAVQGLGGVLIRKIEGDFHNVVGFPAAAFFKNMEILHEEEVDFLSI